MAATPKYKVFTNTGEYVASCKYAEEAAVLVAALGDGTEIRTSHSKGSVVWREGKEMQSAAESYDYVSDKIAARESENDPSVKLYHQAS